MRKLAFVLIAAMALPAAAQNVDIEALAGLQFNFGNPGARSLGMGGAFLGLADDASAAEANPAGLTILRKPEISIEARNYEEQQLFSTSGTFPDVVRTGFTHYSDRVVVSFASFVYPIKNFTLGAYYHEPLNNQGGGIVAAQQDQFTGEITQLPNFFLPSGGGNPMSEAECERLRIERNNPFACLEFRVNPFFSTIDVRQRTFGFAAAWQLHPKFSVGATVRHQRFQEIATTFRFTQNLDLDSVAVQTTAKLEDGELKTVEETDTTFAVGLKWSPTDKISVGAVYKKGPEFTSPLFFAGAATGGELLNVSDTKFHIPDIAGVGISVRPIPVLTINFDAVHVKYTNLIDDFVALVSDVRDLDENPFGMDDVVELRLGGEYVFTTKVPLAVRADFWRDPAHSIEWRGPVDRPDFIAEAMLYPEGEAQNHISVGVGVAWPRFQLDAAYDGSDHFKVLSFSMVTRF